MPCQRNYYLTQSCEHLLLFSPKSFAVSTLKFRSMILLELIFVYCCEVKGLTSFSWICGYPIVPSQYVERIIFSLLNCLGTFVKINWSKIRVDFWTQKFLYQMKIELVWFISFQFWYLILLANISNKSKRLVRIVNIIDSFLTSVKMCLLSLH